MRVSFSDEAMNSLEKVNTYSYLKIFTKKIDLYVKIIIKFKKRNLK